MCWKYRSINLNVVENTKVRKTLLTTLDSILHFMAQKQRSKHDEYFSQSDNQFLFDLELEYMLLFTHIVIP